MTKEEQDKLNQLTQYAQLGQSAISPLPGWGTYLPTQPTAATTTASSISTAVVSPVIETGA